MFSQKKTRVVRQMLHFLCDRSPASLSIREIGDCRLVDLPRLIVLGIPFPCRSMLSHTQFGIRDDYAQQVAHSRDVVLFRESLAKLTTQEPDLRNDMSDIWSNKETGNVVRSNHAPSGTA